MLGNPQSEALVGVPRAGGKLSFMPLRFGSSLRCLLLVWQSESMNLILKYPYLVLPPTVLVLTIIHQCVFGKNGGRPYGSVVLSPVNLTRWLVSGVASSIFYCVASVLGVVGRPLGEDSVLQQYVYTTLVPMAVGSLIAHSVMTYFRMKECKLGVGASMGFCSLAQVVWLLIHAMWVVEVYRGLAAGLFEAHAQQVIRMLGFCFFASALHVALILFRLFVFITVRCKYEAFEVAYYGKVKTQSDQESIKLLQ